MSFHNRWKQPTERFFFEPKVEMPSKRERYLNRGGCQTPLVCGADV